MNRIFRDQAPPEVHERTLRNIVMAMGKQILVDGVFNGDPHPGIRRHCNSLVMYPTLILYACLSRCM